MSICFVYKVINHNYFYSKLRQTCVLAGSSNTLLNFYNSYDAVGNVTQVIDRGTNASPIYYHAYTYDSRDRLTNWAMTGSSTDGQSYTYNAIGNLTAAQQIHLHRPL
jgi:YD repeat-containing protein